MTRETKIGLLIGVVIIVLIGLVVSDHLSVKSHDPSADPSASSIPLLLDGSMPGAGAGSQGMGVGGGEVGGGGGVGGAGEGGGAGNPMATFPTATPQNVPSDSGFAPLPGPAVPSQPVTLPGPTASGDMPVASSGSPFGSPPLAYRTGAAPLPSPALAEQGQAAGAGSSGAGIGLFDQPQPVGEPQPMGSAVMPEPAMPAAEPMPTSSSATLTHTVKASETLWTIAKIHYRDGSQWTKIARANKAKLGSKNQLKIGMTLEIPDVATSVISAPVSTPAQATSTVRTITVAKGDTLEKLAERYLGSKTKAKALFEANRDQLKKPEQLQIGMVLKLPGSATESQASTDNPTVKPEISTPTKSESTYVVQKGDTLYTIARKTLGNAERWREIRDANKDRFGDKENPSLKIGMKLMIPGTANASSTSEAGKAEARSTAAMAPSSASVLGDPMMGQSDQLAPASAMRLTDEPMPSEVASAKPSSKQTATQSHDRY